MPWFTAHRPKQQQHEHRWQEVSRRFTGNLYKAGSISGTGNEIERMFFGLTIIELKCTVCGDVTSRELKGNHLR